MSCSTDADQFRRYTVPRAAESSLVDPPTTQLLSELEAAGDLCGGGHPEFCGQPLSRVREQAREQAVHAAFRFSSQYLPSIEEQMGERRPIILSGHQPELFHSGVWFKSFLLSSLADRSGGVAINFHVDNDLCRTTAIRVPTSKGETAVAKSVIFDRPGEAVPWELRRLQAADAWRQFPTRVLETLMPLEAPPLVTELWSDAIEAVERTKHVGLALAEARHKLEDRLGLRTLEVPLSQLVCTAAFAKFSIQLLSELPRFQEVYNSQVQRYRTAHRIRNHVHPVPQLHQEDGWLEGPWWVYSASAPQRQRLWVRFVDNELTLSNRAGWQATIGGRLDCESVAAQWLDLTQSGICIRPRALMTTMYLRMMVSDLFVHGIGGGKYDQLTEAIVQEFFGLSLPPMAVATATLQLPFADHASARPAAPRDVDREISLKRQQQWQWRYHADQFLDGEGGEPPELERLKQRKQKLLSHIPPRGDKWEWHREMRDLNRRLAALVAPQLEHAKRDLEHLAAVQRRQRILQSREYSFVLFPLEYISCELTKMCN